ncbi:MAG TPA: CHAD domain-containing protein [Gemmatimonas sp.]|nr:CHAD domain-containing protein [Gemmatimonas sp.]
MTVTVPVSRDDISRMLPHVLTATAAEGARVVTMGWYHALIEARDAMSSESGAPGTESNGAAAADPAVLHRARVALRRIRASLKEHRDVLDIGKSLPRALRKLNQATNAARDADVQRAWLEAEGEALGPEARREAARLLSKLSGRGARDRKRTASAFARHLDPIRKELGHRLSEYNERRTLGLEPPRQNFAAHLAARVSTSAGEISAMLTAVVGRGTLDDALNEELHETRIALKRQRAMLAPFAKGQKAIAAWYECATRGQDSLGAMRDASLLASVAAANDMPALEQALQATALGHLEAFHRAWCADDDAVERVASLARAAVAELDGIASASAVPREIERKYLLKGVPPFALETPPTHIEQGWLPGEVLRERLRRATRPDGSALLTRTVKFGRLGSRIELEERADAELFGAMWPHTRNARIRKHRHPVPDSGFVWEVDVFLDRELVIAEVELSDGQDVPAAPAWLAPYIVRDVTDEPQFTNSAMAVPDAATQ